MELFDRIYTVHRLLSTARRPVPIDRFLDEMECTRSTFRRVKERMVNYLDAPIEYDREAGGYYYATGDDGAAVDGPGGRSGAGRKAARFELPGLWFTPSELYALLAAEQLLERAEPGLFARRLKPLETRIRRIIEDSGLDPNELRRRIRLAPAAPRRREARTLGAVTESLMARRRLVFDYRGRARERDDDRTRHTQRIVSPQRLVRYRDNWFLDAWCHEKEATRTFALDRMARCRPIQEPAREIPLDELERKADAGYGIFKGRKQGTARIRFTPFAARWVADEVWHPDQKGQWLTDGRYELEVPYTDPRELLMDILRHGPQAEVVHPPPLRKLMAERVRALGEIYGEEVTDGAPRPVARGMGHRVTDDEA